MVGEDPQGGKFQIGQDMVPHFLDDTETMRGSGHWGCVFTWFKLWDDWLILFCPAALSTDSGSTPEVSPETTRRTQETRMASGDYVSVTSYWCVPSFQGHPDSPLFSFCQR